MEELRELAILDNLEDWECEDIQDNEACHQEEESSTTKSMSLREDQASVSIKEEGKKVRSGGKSDTMLSIARRKEEETVFIPPDTKLSRSPYSHPTVVKTCSGGSSSSSSTKASRLRNHQDGDVYLLQDIDEDEFMDKESVFEAFMGVLFSLFSPTWSLMMAYWHHENGDLSLTVVTLIFLVISTILVYGAYMIVPNSPMRTIWRRSKLLWILCLVPGATTILLAFCDLIFSFREAWSRRKSYSYLRPWRGTRYLYLIESFALAFPQIIMHFVLILEGQIPIYSYQGYFVLSGMFIFGLYLPFARYRFDNETKCDRFGGNIYEKMITFINLWANKWLWVVIFTLTFVCARNDSFGSHQTASVVVPILILFTVFEVPLLLLNCIGSLRLINSLMLVPQFVALTLLLLWINLNALDTSLLKRDNGSMMLGIIFWSEAVILSGWLYDSCMGKEMDLLPFYPHFFGDILIRK